MFTAELDATEFDDWLRSLGTDGARKAMGRTMKETLTKAKTMAARDVRQFYNVKYGDTLKTIRTKQSGGLTGELIARNPMVPAMTYPIKPGMPMPSRHPIISTQIVKGKVTPIKGAFVAVMKSGHKGVFMRTGSKRLPIKEIKSIFTAQQLLALRTHEKVPKDVAEFYDQRLAHNILFLLGKM